MEEPKLKGISEEEFNQKLIELIDQFGGGNFTIEKEVFFTTYSRNVGYNIKFNKHIAPAPKYTT